MFNKKKLKIELLEMKVSQLTNELNKCKEENSYNLLIETISNKRIKYYQITGEFPNIVYLNECQIMKLQKYVCISIDKPSKVFNMTIIVSPNIKYINDIIVERNDRYAI